MRSKSSNKWLREHHSDPYVKKAQLEGYRSRAVYKLQQIQEKDNIIHPGMNIVELGAAPGSWSQYTLQCLRGKGRIIALDILPMKPLDGVTFIEGDFREIATLQSLDAVLDGAAIDLLICDMSPNHSGIKVVDNAKSMYLTELAVDFARNNLKANGDLLTKVFHGAGFDTLLSSLRDCFDKVLTRKPQASRARSQETYLLARGFHKPT